MSRHLLRTKSNAVTFAPVMRRDVPCQPRVMLKMLNHGGNEPRANESQARFLGTDEIVFRAVLFAVLLTFSPATGTPGIFRDLAALAILLRVR